MDVAHSALAAVVVVSMYLMEVAGGPSRPGAAPPADLQRATRVDGQQIALDYVYTAPNACWTNGMRGLKPAEADEMVLTIVPEVKGGVCAQVITFLNYSGTYNVPEPFEILTIKVLRPNGDVIETTQMLIQ